MSGFTGNDGSALIGGLNPSGVVQGGIVDAAGRWLVSQTLGGSPLSDVNPEPNISNIQQMILNGKAFSCSTGKVTAAASMAGSWFSPATSAKNKIIWSVRLFYNNNSQVNETRLITADDANIVAGTSVIGQAVNLKVGGAAPEGVNAMHYAGGVTAPAVAAATQPFDVSEIQAALFMEVLPPGGFLYIPAGVAGGLACYGATTAAGFWTMTVHWTEY